MIFVGVDWAEAITMCMSKMRPEGALAGPVCRRGWRGSPASMTLSAAMSASRKRWRSASRLTGTLRGGIGGGRLSGVRGESDVDLTLPGPSLHLGAKSDPGDAKALADMVRTDRHNHRLLSADSETVQAGQDPGPGPPDDVLVEGTPDQRAAFDVAGVLRAALVAFEDLAIGDALEVLRMAPRTRPGPVDHQDFRRLGSGGRQRCIDERAADIQAALGALQLAAPAAVLTAMEGSVSASVAVISAMVTQIAVLARELEAGFESAPRREQSRENSQSRLTDTNRWDV